MKHRTELGAQLGWDRRAPSRPCTGTDEPGPDQQPEAALRGLRICDLTGQLAGAGATKLLAAFGAQVIRIEDPVRQGRWDLLRGHEPHAGARGLNTSAGFNNHNTEKLGITLNLRHAKGKELFERLVEVSDVVTENFAAGVLARLGFPYERLRTIRPDIIYVTNTGFGYRGPYRSFKSWGPIVQAVSGLTSTSGLPGMPPAGYGFSYMDHLGADYMAVAVLAAVAHRRRTGEGQWVDMSCTDAGATLLGVEFLDATVNGATSWRDGTASSNRSRTASIAPHNIYPARGDDEWVAIVCRDDTEWEALAGFVSEPWTLDPRFRTGPDRAAHEDELDDRLCEWTRAHDKFAIADALIERGVPAAPVRRPEERIDHDPRTGEWGLWPEVEHPEMGRVRVDGLPVHLSSTDWSLRRGAPCLGEHTDEVLRHVLGIDDAELAALRTDGVL